jgi:hypothetical protein
VRYYYNFLYTLDPSYMGLLLLSFQRCNSIYRPALTLFNKLKNNILLRYLQSKSNIPYMKNQFITYIHTYYISIKSLKICYSILFLQHSLY